MRGHRGTSGADTWKPATFIPPTPPWLRAAGEGSEGHGAGSLVSARRPHRASSVIPASLPGPAGMVRSRVLCQYVIHLCFESRHFGFKSPWHSAVSGMTMTRWVLWALSFGRGGSRRRSGCPANPGTWLGLSDRTRLRAVPLDGEGPTEPSADAGGAECCPKSWPSTCWGWGGGGTGGGSGRGDHSSLLQAPPSLRLRDPPLSLSGEWEAWQCPHLDLLFLAWCLIHHQPETPSPQSRVSPPVGTHDWPRENR